MRLFEYCSVLLLVHKVPFLQKLAEVCRYRNVYQSSAC
jgi:hypothetical protein